MGFSKYFDKNFYHFIECFGGTRFRLVAYLCKNANKQNIVRITIEEISKDLFACHNSIARYMLELAKLNFIKKIRSGVYQINPEMIYKGQHKSRMEAVAKYTLAN